MSRLFVFLGNFLSNKLIYIYRFKCDKLKCFNKYTLYVYTTYSVTAKCFVWYRRCFIMPTDSILNFFSQKQRLAAVTSSSNFFVELVLHTETFHHRGQRRQLDILSPVWLVALDIISSTFLCVAWALIAPCWCWATTVVLGHDCIYLPVMSTQKQQIRAAQNYTFSKQNYWKTSEQWKSEQAL